MAAGRFFGTSYSEMNIAVPGGSPTPGGISLEEEDGGISLEEEDATTASVSRPRGESDVTETGAISTFQNPDLLIRNPDLRLKNVDF